MDRTERLLHSDEAATLRSFLGYQRDTLRMKCAGLDQAQLAATLAPSDMSLGGMMKHLACVESGWFTAVTGGPMLAPFDTVDWDAERDWEWRTAGDDSPEELRALFEEACRLSDEVLDATLATSGLDTESVERNEKGETYSLRWIVVHMIEEYARHNGHADLIRESIDGATGL